MYLTKYIIFFFEKSKRHIAWGVGGGKDAVKPRPRPIAQKGKKSASPLLREQRNWSSLVWEYLQSKAMQVIQRSRRFQEELAIHSLGNQNVSRITSNAVL